jgi:hypothetical protein
MDLTKLATDKLEADKQAQAAKIAQDRETAYQNQRTATKAAFELLFGIAVSDADFVDLPYCGDPTPAVIVDGVDLALCAYSPNETDLSVFVRYHERWENPRTGQIGNLADLGRLLKSQRVRVGAGSGAAPLLNYSPNHGFEED